MLLVKELHAVYDVLNGDPWRRSSGKGVDFEREGEFVF